MKKKLTINIKPFIRTLAQYAFIDTIINNVNTNNETVCSLEIQGVNPKDWTYMIENGNIDIKDNTIAVTRMSYGTKPLGGWYKYIEDENEIVFNVKYMQYVNRWDRIIMFLNAHQNFSLDEKLNWNFKLSIHCCGNLRIDVDKKVVFYRSNKENQDIESWYKVKICNSNIEIYVSADCTEWELLHICENVWHTDSDKLIGGFYIHLFDNQYFKWLCNNFIQIRYRKGERDTLGYPGLMNRDWRNDAIHPLVRFGYEKRKIVLKYGIWEYIRNSIDSNRYLEIWLNEYYIEGLRAYKKSTYYHESLIYGYDEENRSIQMLSLYDGKIKALDVPIADLELAWSEPEDCCAIIRSLEYSPDENGYELDVTHICKELQNYLQGRNSTEDYMYIAQKEEGVFGLKVYDDILNTDIGQQEFLSDIRISYMIKEHKECMKLRIDYLYEKEILSSSEYLKMDSIMQNILKMSEVVLNLVLKNKILEKAQTQNKIWDILKNIKEQEQEGYTYLLNTLKKYEESKCLLQLP
ncbi:MAG: hypothetical protein HDQ99_01035 [Lachnospiraceae bacterium]|nr:hypothetical protein [Lachnospiraceae bacterium]